MNFGASEMLLIVAVLFLLFGATRLPQLAKSLGQTRKAFKEGMRAVEEDQAAENAKLSTSTPVGAPEISAVSDEQLMAEMRRRAEAKSQEVMHQ